MSDQRDHSDRENTDSSLSEFSPHHHHHHRHHHPPSEGDDRATIDGTSSLPVEEGDANSISTGGDDGNPIYGQWSASAQPPASSPSHAGAWASSCGSSGDELWQSLNSPSAATKPPPPSMGLNPSPGQATAKAVSISDLFSSGIASSSLIATAPISRHSYQPHPSNAARPASRSSSSAPRRSFAATTMLPPAGSFAPDSPPIIPIGSLSPTPSGSISPVAASHSSIDILSEIPLAIAPSGAAIHAQSHDDSHSNHHHHHHNHYQQQNVYSRSPQATTSPMQEVADRVTDDVVARLRNSDPLSSKKNRRWFSRIASWTGIEMRPWQFWAFFSTLIALFVLFYMVSRVRTEQRIVSARLDRLERTSGIVVGPSSGSIVDPASATDSGDVVVRPGDMFRSPRPPDGTPSVASSRYPVEDSTDRELAGTSRTKDDARWSSYDFTLPDKIPSSGVLRVPSDPDASVPGLDVDAAVAYDVCCRLGEGTFACARGLDVSKSAAPSMSAHLKKDYENGSQHLVLYLSPASAFSSKNCVARFAQRS